MVRGVSDDSGMAMARGVSNVPGAHSLPGVFRALAATIVPEAGELDEAGWESLESIVLEALADRPASVRRQLRLFIRVLGVAPLVRYGRTFRGLDPARRAAFLRRVERSPVFLLRRGFWGLRTLVYMGYYARREAGEAIGYGARLRGWLEHPDAPEAARQATRAGRPGPERPSSERESR